MAATNERPPSSTNKRLSRDVASKAPFVNRAGSFPLSAGRAAREAISASAMPTGLPPLVSDSGGHARWRDQHHAKHPSSWKESACHTGRRTGRPRELDARSRPTSVPHRGVDELRRATLDLLAVLLMLEERTERVLRDLGVERSRAEHHHRA